MEHILTLALLLRTTFFLQNLVFFDFFFDFEKKITKKDIVKFEKNPNFLIFFEIILSFGPNFAQFFFGTPFFDYFPVSAATKTSFFELSGCFRFDI